jgi:predicted PurR-regulated permease PerM
MRAHGGKARDGRSVLAADDTGLDSTDPDSTDPESTGREDTGRANGVPHTTGSDTTGSDTTASDTTAPEDDGETGDGETGDGEDGDGGQAEAEAAVERASEASDDTERMEETMAAAAALAEETGGLGEPGRPLNRRSPFFIGMAAAAGVAITYGLAELLIRARSVLVLIGLALFIAAGLDPVVGFLTKRGLPRWSAVVIILLAVAGVIAGFFTAAIPPMTQQVTSLIHQLPHYAHQLQDHNSELGRLNQRYQIQQRVTKLLSTKGTALIGGALGAGELVLGAATSVLVVIVLSVYFLSALPRVKVFAYRLAPQSRRTRVILIGDEIFTKVGGYVLGNFLTSAIAGLGTFLWLVIFGVPYPLLLALLVAFLDLIPVIGSTVGGAIVALVSLTISVPVALATVGFYVAYRLAEDYFIVPRIMGRTVQVPAVVTVLAVLVGGALMGIIGALVAIPVAAALRLLLQEVAFRRLDNS